MKAVRISERSVTSKKLHGATSQKAVIFLLAAVRTKYHTLHFVGALDQSTRVSTDIK
jgi:hypothetical protein